MKHDIVQLQFAFEVPARRKTGVEMMWIRAMSNEVRASTMAILAARPGEWLKWRDFRAVIDGQRIGACFGHILAAYAREGAVLERKVYFGAECPSSPDYAGYGHEWSAA
ncbi:hypothetical protein HSX11_01610 [Oxalobacteraceae bacterium]|nr:hypothetical protein [Oxalobacteraceae bacterium]